MPLVRPGLHELGGGGAAARHLRPGAAAAAGGGLLVFVAGDAAVGRVVPGEGDELVAGGGGEARGRGGIGPCRHFVGGGAVARRAVRAHLEGVADAGGQAGHFLRRGRSAGYVIPVGVAGFGAALGLVAEVVAGERVGRVGPTQRDLLCSRRGRGARGLARHEGGAGGFARGRVG